MEELEAGKENSTEDVNIENVDNIICDEELQPEVINAEIHQPHSRNSETIEDISTIQDSKEVLCQFILLDILENIFKQPSDSNTETVTYNHQNINPNENTDDEILQMNVEETILEPVHSMKENIFQDIVKDKSSTSTSEPPQKMTQKVKGKYSELSL